MVTEKGRMMYTLKLLYSYTNKERYLRLLGGHYHFCSMNLVFQKIDQIRLGAGLEIPQTQKSHHRGLT